MNIELIPVGDDPPNNVNVIIEVPVGGEPVKYEFDKKSGALFVDRILHTPMRYPANYGFVPHTLSPDGDPLDALVPSIIFQQIEHFFTHYKDLEKDKWVRVGKWGDAADARRILTEAIDRAKESAAAAG